MKTPRCEALRGGEFFFARAVKETKKGFSERLGKKRPLPEGRGRKGERLQSQLLLQILGDAPHLLDLQLTVAGELGGILGAALMG